MTKRILLLFSMFAASSLSFAKTIKDIACIHKENGSITVDVKRINLTDNATTLTFSIIAANTNKFRLNRDIFIVDDNGKKHYATSADGIRLDSLYILCKNEKRTFSVIFPPVSSSNTSLDVCSPGSFTFYGLHDKHTPLNIPAARGDVDMSDFQPGFFQLKPTEIEGVLHGEDVAGNIVYCNYIEDLPLRINSSRVNATHYAVTDANGHFKMEFNMSAPQAFDFDLNSSTLGFITARPGDKIHIEINKDRTARITNSQNLTRNGMIWQANAPLYYPSREVLYENMTSNFSKFSFEEHIGRLYDEYKKAIDFANYACWHNHLNPYETQLYLNQMHVWYIGDFVTALRRQNSLALEAGQGESERYATELSKVDYSCLQNIDPDNPSFFVCYRPIAGLISSIPSIEACIDKMKPGTQNRWMKIIELQQQELERLTGWKGMNNIMQGIIARNAERINKRQHVTETEFNEVRSLLTHPFWRMYLDKLRENELL